MDPAHIHLDEFARLGSFFHKFDPRVKFLSCLIFLTMVVSLRTYKGLGLAFLFIVIFLLGSRLPVGCILKRLGLVIPVTVLLIFFLPFIRPGHALFQLDLGLFILSYTWEGLQASGIFFLRLLCGALILILMTFTTPFHVLLRSLTELRIPQIFTQLIQFTLRYFFVLQDEIIRMHRARLTRNFCPAQYLWHRHTLKTVGGLLGVLFIRAFERGERVYHAMLARGFQGEIRTLYEFQVYPKDFCFGLIILILGLVSFFVDRGGWVWLNLSK